MTEIPAERKLELIRRIREENMRNRNNLRSRERILYGRSGDSLAVVVKSQGEADAGYSQNTLYTSEEAEEKTHTFSGLWVRTMMATLFFAFYIILDFTSGSVMNVNANGIYNSITKNYTSNIIDFMEEITYTLKNTGESLTR